MPVAFVVPLGVLGRLRLEAGKQDGEPERRWNGGIVLLKRSSRKCL